MNNNAHRQAVIENTLLYCINKKIAAEQLPLRDTPDKDPLLYPQESQHEYNLHIYKDGHMG